MNNASKFRYVVEIEQAADKPLLTCEQVRLALSAEIDRTTSFRHAFGFPDLRSNEYTVRVEPRSVGRVIDGETL